MEVLDALHSANAERISLKVMEGALIGPPQDPSAQVLTPDGRWRTRLSPDGFRSPMTSIHPLWQTRQTRENPELVRQQLLQSGLTQSEIRAQLTSLGYPADALDQFLLDSGGR